MPVMRTGSPPGSTRWSPRASSPENTATPSSIRVRSIGTRRRQEREREDQVDAELGRVGNRGSEQEAAARGDVPGDEQAELDTEQERERPLARARGDAERLVGEEEGRDRPLVGG